MIQQKKDVSDNEPLEVVAATSKYARSRDSGGKLARRGGHK